MKTIPAIDLVAQHEPLRRDLVAAFERVLAHGQLILGPEVTELENALQKRLGAGSAVGVASGTDALVLALKTAGVGPGDEVITVSHSFFATASAIAILGATPIFVDVHPRTLTMDPTTLDSALTPRTRAVLPVHLMGSPCDMTPIVSFASKHGLALVEDCAQSIGATLDGHSTGTFGTGAFSLHPLKVLSALGDGGFLTTNDSAKADEMRVLRNLGMRERGVCSTVSGNSRLDTLQAALLLVKLRHLDHWLTARRKHAAAYTARLGEAFDLVDMPSGGISAYSVYVVRSPDRDALIREMGALGFDLKAHYPLAIHQQPAFTKYAHGPLPVTERIVREIVSLPVAPELPDSDRERLIDSMLSWRGRRDANAS